jgi:hypothetical protein
MGRRWMGRRWIPGGRMLHLGYRESGYSPKALLLPPRYPAEASGVLSPLYPAETSVLLSPLPVLLQLGETALLVWR